MMKKNTIKVGAQYKDGWGRMWFVVHRDSHTGKYFMRMLNNPGADYFSIAEINNNFTLINP